MPVVNGIEAAESLREYPVTAGIPIVGLAGSVGWLEQERMRRVCDEVLFKPCTPDELLEWIHDLETARESFHLSPVGAC
jgi:CheY-like chemotaxis protein